MMEHDTLVAEMREVEHMSTADRLRHAKKRRTQQLKRWQQFERETVKKKKGQSDSRHPSPEGTGAKPKRSVRFVRGVELLEATARNGLEEVSQLLSDDVSPDSTNEDGLTPLHQCAIEDYPDMASMLMDFGANVNAVDTEKWTPLHAAATCGHTKLCQLLITRGADLLAVNADGNMPYDLCEDELTLDMIESEMARRGVTQELIDGTRSKTETVVLADLHRLRDQGNDLEFTSADSATQLHLAAAHGYVRVMEFLLDNHVTIDRRDRDGWTPLHAAVCWGQGKAVELLIENGADLQAKTPNDETVFELCEDPELRQWLQAKKDELAAAIDLRKPSGQTRSSLFESSNASMNRGSSIRRSSQRGRTKKLDTSFREALEAQKQNDVHEETDKAPAEASPAPEQTVSPTEAHVPETSEPLPSPPSPPLSVADGNHNVTKSNGHPVARPFLEGTLADLKRLRQEERLRTDKGDDDADENGWGVVAGDPPLKKYVAPEEIVGEDSIRSCCALM